MSNSGTIPVYASTSYVPNAHYNQAFSHFPVDRMYRPQSPPYSLDPRSPRTVYNIPSFEQSPTKPTHQMNRFNNATTDEMYLHQTFIGEIQNHVANGLDSRIWGYFTYMEYNQRIISTYINNKEFFVDNSANQLDIYSLGLASLTGLSRTPEAQNIRQEIHKGIVLSSDEEGNIYLRNDSKAPVRIKGFDEPERYCVSESAIRLRGEIMPGNEVVKVFDIEEFRSQIGLQILNGYTSEEDLRLMCLIGICFSEARSGLNSPCWILLVNVTAFKMVGNEEVRTEIEEYVARLCLGTSNKLNQNKLPSKNKINNEIKITRRKTRIELRKQGKKIKDHMKYSWNNVYFKKDETELNLETLKEEFEDPDVDYDDSDEDSKSGEETKMQVDLQRLKTIVRSKSRNSRSAQQSTRPVKHWAKLSYIIKRHSGSDAY